MGSTIGYHTEQQAIEAWNRRAHGTCRDCIHFSLGNKAWPNDNEQKIEQNYHCSFFNEYFAKDFFCGNWEKKDG